MRAPRLAPGLRTYYALLLTEGVSLVGSRVSGLAVSIAVFRQTGHATPLALVAFFSYAPAIVLGGLAGALADRFDRRALMLGANVGLVLTNALLLYAFASGGFRLWQLYGLSFASALFAALEGPAFQASTTMLVPEAHRNRANALGQVTSPAAGVIAPGVAALLYALVGVAGAIALDIATFVAAILVLMAVRIPAAVRTAEGQAMQGSLLRQSLDGYRYLAARPVLLALCGYVSVVNFLVGVAGVLVAPYVLARSRSDAAFGLVIGALNLGGVAGSLALAVWGGTRRRVHMVFPALAVGGVFLALSGAARGPLALAPTLFLFMAAFSVVNASAMSIFQAKIAPDIQGRVFAAMGQINGLLVPVAFLLAGPLADQVFEPARRRAIWRLVAWAVGEGPGAGMGLMFLIGGAATSLVSLGVYAVAPIRRMEITLPDHDPRPAGA